MIEQDTRLVTLVQLVGRLPSPPLPARHRRGRPPTSPDRRFLQALVLMIGRPRHTVHARLRVLAQPTSEMPVLRAGLTVDGRCPPRRTWARRVHPIPATLPAPMGCRGRALVVMLPPWATGGRAAALDRPRLRARGGVWHQQDREAGRVPPTAMATEAPGRQSGGHGGVSGGKRHLVTTGAGGWSPLAADLTAAHVADQGSALTRLPERPAEGRDVLGDQHAKAPVSDAVGGQAGQTVVATRRGSAPHPDDGVEGRRIVPALRARDRKPPRTVPGPFRRARPGADHGAAQHAPVGPGRRVRLSAHAVVPARARAGPPRRLEPVSQGSLSPL